MNTEQLKNNGILPVNVIKSATSTNGWKLANEAEQLPKRCLLLIRWKTSKSEGLVPTATVLHANCKYNTPEAIGRAVVKAWLAAERYELTCNSQLSLISGITYRAAAVRQALQATEVYLIQPNGKVSEAGWKAGNTAKNLRDAFCKRAKLYELAVGSGRGADFQLSPYTIASPECANLLTAHVADAIKLGIFQAGLPEQLVIAAEAEQIGYAEAKKRFKTAESKCIAKKKQIKSLQEKLKACNSAFQATKDEAEKAKMKAEAVQLNKQIANLRSQLDEAEKAKEQAEALMKAAEAGAAA